MSKWTACLWHGPACPPRNASTRAQALFRACCHAPTCFVTYAGAPIFGQVQAHIPRPLEKFLKNQALVWMLALWLVCFHPFSTVFIFFHVRAISVMFIHFCGLFNFLHVSCFSFLSFVENCLRQSNLQSIHFMSIMFRYVSVSWIFSLQNGKAKKTNL